MEKTEKQYGGAYKPAPLLRRMIEAGFGGTAAGTGIYRWQDGNTSGTNPILEEYLN